MNQDNVVGSTFSETQQFRQPFLWVALILVAAVMWYLLVTQVLFRSPIGQDLIPKLVLVVFWLLFGVGLPALFHYGGLVTRVENDGIYLRFVPFLSSPRKLAFSDIKSCEVRTYSAMKEYGGWGVKYGRGGKAYNVSGNMGVQLEFNDGKRLLIGSQKSEQLCQAIQAKMPRHSVQ